MRVRWPLWHDEYEREQSESESKRAQVRVESERLASSRLQHYDVSHGARVLTSVGHDARGLPVQTGHQAN